jgi:hypothetical protein
LNVAKVRFSACYKAWEACLLIGEVDRLAHARADRIERRRMEELDRREHVRLADLRKGDACLATMRASACTRHGTIACGLRAAMQQEVAQTHASQAPCSARASSWQTQAQSQKQVQQIIQQAARACVASSMRASDSEMRLECLELATYKTVSQH